MIDFFNEKKSTPPFFWRKYFHKNANNFDHRPTASDCLRSLGFSVTVFCIEALVAILILFIRRSPSVGGELGGPKNIKTITSGIFVFLWVFYVMISALEAYKVIEPGTAAF
jgi:hypothetical protein